MNQIKKYTISEKGAGPYDPGRSGTLSKRRLWYRWILMLAAIAAVAWVAGKNIDNLADVTVDFNISYIIASFIAASGAYSAILLAWMRLASIFRLRAPFPAAARAYFLSQLARYMPGKIGIFLMRAEIYGGRSATGVIMATAMEQIAVLAAAFFIVLLGIFLTPSLFPAWMRYISIAGLVLTFLMMKPSILRAISRSISRISGKEIIGPETTLYMNITLVLLYSIPCILHGLSLFLVINSLYPIPLGYLPAVSGAYIGAILAGLFAVFIPGGLGVREGALILALQTIVPGEIAVTAAVIVRLVTIAVEILLAAGFSAYAGISSRRHR
jgi:uncharacterized membrane protein YbhN (UPF0104 family)